MLSNISSKGKNEEGRKLVKEQMIISKNGNKFLKYSSHFCSGLLLFVRITLALRLSVKFCLFKHASAYMHNPPEPFLMHILYFFPGLSLDARLIRLNSEHEEDHWTPGCRDHHRRDHLQKGYNGAGVTARHSSRTFGLDSKIRFTCCHVMPPG